MFQNVLFWTKTDIYNKRFLITKKAETPVIIWIPVFSFRAGEAGFEPAWAVLETGILAIVWFPFIYLCQYLSAPTNVSLSHWLLIVNNYFIVILFTNKCPIIKALLVLGGAWTTLLEEFLRELPEIFSTVHFGYRFLLGSIRVIARIY